MFANFTSRKQRKDAEASEGFRDSRIDLTGRVHKNPGFRSLINVP